MRWSRSAQQDLLDIIEYIGSDRPEAARRMGTAILDAADRLSRNPFRCVVTPDLLRHGIGEYRQLLVRQYRIVYRVTDEEVRIMAVLDSRRNLEDILLARLLREWKD